MVRTVPVVIASILFIFCYISLSTGAPMPADIDYDGQAPNVNDLYLWDDKPLNDTANIPGFEPVPVDTTNNCPSCLPDALLSGRRRW